MFLACGAAPPPATASKLPDDPRRPDGVVVEPSPAIPATRDRAPAEGIVALRSPLPEAAILAVARAYVRAVIREDRDGLDSLLAPGARMLDRAREPIVDRWLARFRANDYARFAGQDLVRAGSIEQATYDEIPPLARPNGMREGDVFVSFQTPAPRGGTDAPFGGSVALLLRRDGGHFVIVGASDASP